MSATLPAMPRLLVYHDFASPFSRLGVHAATEAAERTGFRPVPVPFELSPPPGPLGRYDRGPLADELDRARTLAESWGVALDQPARVPRTRKAHEAVAFAAGHERDWALMAAIYEALWSDGSDIGRLDVLARLGENVGLDPEALHVALGVDDHEADVARIETAAAAAGVHGVPAYQVGEVMAVGVFPAQELAEWIEENRATGG
jgi:predicted DsbA family dithiol-disulfide isomerase